METIIPKTSTVFSALLRADLTTQWRNRRGAILSLMVPVIILISWKGYIAKIGGPATLANSLCYGLLSLGLMGYSNSIARDRDKGIFQRLRVAPLPSWAIMVSRLSVQLIMIMIITTAIFIVGFNVDKISLSPAGYLVTYFTAAVGGAVYLALGQAIVGLTKNAETVNSASRLVFLAFMLIGTFGGLGALGPEIQEITHWTPYGTVETIMAAGMAPAKWDTNATNALLVTLGYIVVFATVGIKKFKWESK